MQPLNRKYYPLKIQQDNTQPKTGTILICTIIVLICNVTLILGSIAALHHLFGKEGEVGRNTRSSVLVANRLGMHSLQSVKGSDSVNEFVPKVDEFVVNDANRKQSFWLVEAVEMANSFQEKSAKMLKDSIKNLLSRAYQRDVLDSTAPFDLRDAKSMIILTSCSEDESLAADTTNPASDCGLLQQEFGMCHAFVKSSLDSHNGRTFGDLDQVRTPFAQGYITVEGLEDPVAAAAAMYDEAHRLENSDEAPYFPIAATPATMTDKKGKIVPFTFDIVYTEVDFTEPSFQADRFVYRDKVPPISAHTDEAAAERPSVRSKKQRAEALSIEQATLVLPHVWASITEGTLGESLTRDSKYLAMSKAKRNNSLADANVTKSSLEEMTANLSTRYEAADHVIRDQMQSDLDPYAALPLPLHSLFRTSRDSVNRFRNYNELRYSLRGVYRHIIQPAKQAAKDTNNGRISLGKIFIVLSHRSQAPPWLQEDPHIELVEHRELFPDPSRSLPTFNSRAIESVLHRIKGLGRHYIYLNNDFMLARPVSFFDFFQPHVLWTLTGSAVVRWLPALQSCSVLFGGGVGDRRLRNSLAPKELNTITFVGKMVGSDPLGFAITFSHVPQMYDKLQVMRMMVEPSIRKTVCNTRGSRQRSEDNIPSMYSYQHFALLWRQGWGPDAAKRAIISIFPQEYGRLSRSSGSLEPFTDSLGRRRSQLWDYLEALHRAAKENPPTALHMNDFIFKKATSSFPTNFTDNHARVLEALSSIITLVPGVTERRMGEKIALPTSISQLLTMENVQYQNVQYQPEEMIHVNPKSRSEGSPKTYDHWVIDLYRHLKQPVITLGESQKAFFGMAEDVPRTQQHIRTVQKLKGKVLFVTENDDLPPGSRDPSPSGIFGQLSKMAISYICTWPRSIWSTAALSTMLSVVYEEDDISEGESPSSSNDTIKINRLRVAVNGSYASRFPAPDSDDPFMEVLFGDTKKLQPSLHRGKHLQWRRRQTGLSLSEHRRRQSQSRGGKKNARSGRGHWGLQRREAPVLGNEVSFDLADRIQCACAYEDAYNSVLAMEIASGRYSEVEEDGNKRFHFETHAECRDGARYGKQTRNLRAQRFYRDYQVRPNAFIRQDFAHVRRHREAIQNGQKATAQQFYVLESPDGLVRHNCSLFPLPYEEVPPSADVYAVDLFLEVIRTAVGDCDVTLLGSPEKLNLNRPNWEINGC